MAYLDFADDLQGQKERKAFWLSKEGLLLIMGWRRNGVALTVIAEEHIGVCKTTFWNWYHESEELRKACAIAKDVADTAVEDALWRRAVGYDYWEEVWDLIEGELRLSRKLKKHMPPDTKAIMQWLFNRLPLQWRALQEPLQDTQYTETIKSILVAMKEVAENGDKQTVDVKEDSET